MKKVGTANEQGTGLGLDISREIVEMNGRNIWVESERGKGSRFIFTLPVSNNSSSKDEQQNSIPNLNYKIPRIGLATSIYHFLGKI